ncbi:type IV pilus assembly protein PilA [Lachnospiraceae bacterium NLAE-zl-G231]|nr:type IV pilus assembly protein PilA [Lachnospiraceae bacterium NLAE-zl-G231]
MNLVERLKKDKKGFTLVEMIVVIVIIGILLAILVPGMFKYIQKAKDKQIMVDARTAYLDIQMAAQEAYGINGATGGEVKTEFDGNYTAGANTKSVKSVNFTVDIPGNGEVSGVEIEAETGKVTAMKYTLGDREVEMSGGVWKEVTAKQSGTNP